MNSIFKPLNNSMWSIVILMLLCQCTLNQGNVRVDPIVETKVGFIKGLQATDGDYSMFLGIPYAQIDEHNPFGLSTPEPDFDDVFEAFDDSSLCPQALPFSGEIEGTLDCLRLSVYVPNSANFRNVLPVMVYIHGGGFSDGSFEKSTYGPKFLVRHDVILVTLNYRLGPYGFMCLDIPEVPGNQGLKDQLTALRWIKDNIASFGGDVGKITLFGESAGAASADLHFRFNKEKLFDQIILQSGSASSPWGIIEPDLEYSIKLAKQLGYETKNLDSSLHFLKTVDPHVLIGASLNIDSLLNPCPEKDFDGVEKFISDYAINIKMPRANITPILLGVNDEEWQSFYVAINEEDFKNVDDFNDNLNKYFNFTADEQANMVNIVKRFYIGDREISKSEEVGISEFASDFMFIHPAARSIGEYFKDGASKIYQYVFSFYGNRNYFKANLNNTGSSGAFHADELGYLFNMQEFTNVISDGDQLMIDRITTLWTNFAKTGDPTPSTTDLLPVKWPHVTPDNYHYLNLDSELTLHSRPFQERMAFWDLFYAMKGEKRRGYNLNT